jgi:hypothetical protein
MKKISQRTIPCDDALLIGANKRFALLYNMNITNILFIYDIQKDDTKEFQWDEGILVRKNHFILETLAERRNRRQGSLVYDVRFYLYVITTLVRLTTTSVLSDFMLIV